MARQIVNLGTLADGSDGDTNKVAWGKAKDNFAELYTNAADAQLKGGMRNLLINACGAINQRAYVSGTATTVANQYTVDRWKVRTSGQNASWTTSSGIATFTAPAGGFAQIVEGSSILGGSYTLSWTGTATATVAGAAVTSGTPFTLPANTNAEVVFSSGTVSQPQLELGAQTPFELRPHSIERVLCERYAFALDGSDGITFAFSGFANSTTNLVIIVTLPSVMRATPTATATGLVAQMPAGTTGAITLSSSALNRFGGNVTFSGSGFTNGAPAFLRFNSSSARVVFDAEL